MLTSMYLQESKGKKDGVVGRTKPCMPTVGYNGEEVKFTYATRVDGGGQPYPASRDATTPFFFLASYRP